MVAPDIEILRQIAQGDRTAVATLYDRYAPVVYPLANRILRDGAEAEDIVHDAFMLVADRADHYCESRGSVAAWLVTLVRNLSIDRLRKRQRRAHLAREAVQTEPVDELHPEALVGLAALRAAVLTALGSLDDAHRNTLESAFFQGLSYVEIAERDGVPLGTVKSRAARAMATLRATLEASGVGIGQQ